MTRGTIKFYANTGTYGSIVPGAVSDEDCGHPHKSRESAAKCLGKRLNCTECSSYVGMGPSHNPSQYCKSGKRPHCTCDTCF